MVCVMMQRLMVGGTPRISNSSSEASSRKLSKVFVVFVVVVVVVGVGVGVGDDDDDDDDDFESAATPPAGRGVGGSVTAIGGVRADIDCGILSSGDSGSVSSLEYFSAIRRRSSSYLFSASEDPSSSLSLALRKSSSALLSSSSSSGPPLLLFR